MARDRTLVFSTETGRIKPDDSPVATIGDGNVRVRLEKKGRGGKTVTTISGLPLEPEALKALGKKLKKKCGVGGAVKDGIVEIQGDHAEKIVTALRAEGYDAKRSGG